ncbi:MAG: hypothetical protein DSM106950_41950 [Stigonema ocellatum SAG 48.90 = DSM 106950]|nr:hypothetical protein [Stigonema ocellatum SAG 48.90 = DSM 106950]
MAIAFQQRELAVLGATIRLKELATSVIAIPDLVRYVFNATNLGKKGLSVPQLLRKRYIPLCDRPKWHCKESWVAFQQPFG